MELSIRNYRKLTETLTEIEIASIILIGLE